MSSGVAAARPARGRLIDVPEGGRWPRLPVALLALGGAISFAVLIAMGTHLTFFLDDWDFIQVRYSPSLDAVMTPHNEHISIAPVLIYEALLNTFSADSSTPFRVVATVVFLAGVGVLFVWVRRRVGAWLALAATLPLLFFGAGAEDLLFPFQLGYFGSLLFGIAALLALENEDRRSDALACAALVASLTFSSVALPFIVGAVVRIAWDERRRERAYIVVVPIVLYVLWWIGWGHEADTHVTLRAIATSPSYVLDGFASSLGSLLGLGASRPDAVLTGLDWGRSLLVGAVALAGWRLAVGPRPDRWFWVVLAIALSYWFLAAFSAYFPARGATAGRYQYVGAILILMLAAELLRGYRLSTGAVVAVFAGVAVSIGGNASQLSTAYDANRTSTELVRGDLAVLGFARGIVPDAFRITRHDGGTDFVGVAPAFYFPAVDAIGTPAYSEPELLAAPEGVRGWADRLGARVLGLTSDTVARPALAPPAPTLTDGGGTAGTGACISVDPGPDRMATLTLPRGGAALSSEAPGGGEVTLRRFSSVGFPIAAGQIPQSGQLVVRIPADAARTPWQARVQASAPFRACGLAAAAT